MDSLSFFRRLTPAFLFVVLAGLVLPAYASCSQYVCSTYAEAMAGCQAAIGPNSAWSCVYQPPSILEQDQWGNVNARWSFTGSPPSPDNQICQDNVPVAVRWEHGKFLNDYSTTMTATDPGSGVTVNCKVDMTAVGPPICNSATVTDGCWFTLFSIHPDSSGWGTQTPPPAGGVVDAHGDSVSDNSGLPASAASVSGNQSAPNVCQGGSCYDPNSGQACAVWGGKQQCISVPQSLSSQTSTPANCFAVGDGSLCQGNPPPLPSNTVITDPATQIKSSDNYVFADPTTGQNYQDGVTVYTLPGTTASSGQKSGDDGPAPASSTGSKDVSGYAGGTDCVTPPVCTGDAATCGAARTEWATVCQVHKDLAGDSAPTSADDLANGGTYDQTSVWTSAGSSGDAVADSANQGNYDESGLGVGSGKCPMADLSVPLGSQSFTIPLSEGCVIGPWIHGIVIAMALFWAAQITAGSGKGV